MKNPTKKNQGFTLIELLTVITIIGILFGLAFKAGDVALTAGAKAKEKSNMRNILQAYKSYHDSNGGITENIEEEEMVDDTDPDEPAYSQGTNHDWAGVLAEENAEMNDASIYMLKRDKFAKKENRKHKARNILDPDADEDNPKLDEDFKNSILCFNMFAGLEASDDFGASRTPAIYTAGLNEEGKWLKKAPHGPSGGHIGYMDTHVVSYKKIEEKEFVKHDDIREETLRLSEAVYGVALGHRGEDDFTGERE